MSDAWDRNTHPRRKPVAARSPSTFLNYLQIYSGRTASQARRNQELPNPPSAVASPPVVGAYKAFPLEEKAVIPEVTPMRRGRPTELRPNKPSAKPSPSSRRVVASDPFAALDSGKSGIASTDPDDISKRFPSLDQFSLLHESGGNFAFDQKPQAPAQPKELSQRVTEALADEAFISASIPEGDATPQSISVPTLANRTNVGTQTLDSPKAKGSLSKTSTMVSTGTMTSPRTSLDDKPDLTTPELRVPQTDNRASSQPRPFFPPNRDQPEMEISLRPRPTLLDHRSISQTTTVTTSKAPLSARASLESQRRPSSDLGDPITRTRSDAGRSRPLSAHPESATRFLHSRSPSQNKIHTLKYDPPASAKEVISSDGEAANISSNVDFLKAMEEEEPNKRKEKRQSSSSKSGKRTSLPSISLSGTKSLLAGRFGDAFKRFEGNNVSNEDDRAPDTNLTPITGSIAADDRSDDGRVLEESEEMPPEMRRELERRRLSQEERRVAGAAAAYKQRFADNGGGGGRPEDSSRAMLIQNKVQSLLDESNKASPTKTAEGYGRFTTSTALDSDTVSPADTTAQTPSKKLFQHPPTSRIAPPSASGGPAPPPQMARPSAPPKPQVLRTGGSLPTPTVAAKPSHLSNRQPQAQPVPPLAKAETTPMSPEDWEATFSKRYPNLAGLEMVETEIRDKGSRIIRDV